jgi:oxygen-dependent protoporphyrinogen oxidase
MGDMAPFDNETIHDFCMREFNEEIDTWLASPLIRAGSLTGTREAPFGDWLWQTVGFRYPHMMQWDQGMDFFAQSLARGLDIKFNTSVTDVRNDSGKATLQIDGANTIYDACVIAVPAPVACAIAPSITPQQKEFFGNIRPVPMISVHLGLRGLPESKDAVILIPEKESADLLMILLDHNKVAGRAPAGKGIVTIWSTKEWTAAHVGDTDEQIIAELCRLAKPFIGKIDDMIEISHVERCDFVVAQTYPGFFTRLRDYMATRNLDQPLFFSGDFSAEGIEGATLGGLNAARHVEGYLAPHK